MGRQTTTRTVKMPKWGLSMQEGTITLWHVRPGDRVTAGSPLCDIETTKITNEFEAPASGIVARLLVGTDEVVAIGRPIAILADEDAQQSDIDAAVADAERSAIEGSGDPFVGPVLGFVDAAGSRLAYLEAGKPSSSHTVVFLHGFGGDHDNWAMTQEAVGAEGFRTLAFDLPGHGASGKSVGDGSAEAVAAIVGAGLEALGIERIALVAHSFGALVAAALVRDAGLDIGRVILIAPVGVGSAPNPAYIRGFLGAERKRDLKPVMEMLFADPAMLGRGIVSDALAMLRNDDARRALQLVGSKLLDLGPEELTSWQTLPGPDPHVIWGDRDAILPLDENVAQALKGRLHVIAASGHMPHVEQPAAVNGLIARLLSE